MLTQFFLFELKALKAWRTLFFSFLLLVICWFEKSLNFGEHAVKIICFAEESFWVGSTVFYCLLKRLMVVSDNVL